MTREDKELLKKDLCARLAYGVVLNVGDKDIKLDRRHQNIGVMYPEDCTKEFNERNGCQDFYIVISGCYYGEDVKPYLRPMSSMTDEERKEFDKLINLVEERCINGYGKGGYSLAFTELNDWLNAHLFDYRGLIDKGLALEAPEGMYTF